MNKNIKLYRTYLSFTIDNKTIKLSYFDFNDKLKLNKINSCCLTYLNNDYVINENILTQINIKMTKLLIDIYISDLIYKGNIKEDWVCNICLDNDKKDYIKLDCCNIIYHRKCIEKFWKTNCTDNKFLTNICPICKTYIYLDYEDGVYF